MNTPSISIAIAISSGAQLLSEMICSLQEQSFSNYEVLCITDTCDAETMHILNQTVQTDKRFLSIHQPGIHTSAMRNFCLQAAKGDYIVFPNFSDLFSPLFLEKLYGAITQTNADIAVCNYCKPGKNGKLMPQQAIYTNWLPAGAASFNYMDCSDYILRVIEPVLWNRLFRTAFLRTLNKTLDNIISDSPLCLAAISVAAAGKVSFILENLTQARSVIQQDFNEIEASVFQTVARARKLPHSRQIENAITSFPVNHFIRTLAREIKDFSTPVARKFYQMVHETFNQEDYANISATTLRNPLRYREFCTVKKHDYEAMLRLISRKLIVSLTTYPRRIHAIAQVLESLYAQTRKADEIVLWLAEEQFPKKEQELPGELLKLVEEKRLTIRWCDDLKAHKKYFYAFREYADDLIVTVDDDLTYSRNMLNTLYQSYLLYPSAVSTVRAHLILVSPQKEVLPYRTWIQETDSCLHTPCLQLLATGGAGVLYPPHLFREEFFDKQAVMQHCPLADDLWLKAMQLASDVPVVVACTHEPLQYLPDTQGEALHYLNVRQHQNDVQLANIIRWMDTTFEPDFFIQKLTNSKVGIQILDQETVCRHIDEQRLRLRRKNSQLETQLLESDTQLNLAKADNQKAEEEILQKEAQLVQSEQTRKQTAEQLDQAERKLQNTTQKLKQLEDSKPIRAQLKALRAPLSKQCCKAKLPINLAIYYLAWIPEIILEGMMYYLKNGAKQTMKQIYCKLFRRKK